MPSKGGPKAFREAFGMLVACLRRLGGRDDQDRLVARAREREIDHSKILQQNSLLETYD